MGRLCRPGGLWERQECFSTSVLFLWGNTKRAKVKKETEERQETWRSAGTD